MEIDSEAAPRDARETHGAGSREPAEHIINKSVTLTVHQAKWLELAAENQDTSQSAIVRGALETYQRLHPTWVPSV